MTARTLANIGKIKEITLPDGWHEEPSYEDLFSQAWKVAFTAKSEPGVELAFFYRGQPIDPNSVQTFKTLADLKPAYGGPEKLAPPEVASLRIMMGFETLGNNQYTNPGPIDSPTGRAFDLTLAQTRRVADMVVLYVRGMFASGIHYEGILFPADHTGRIIQEMGVHTPSKQLCDEFEPVFHTVLDTIVWNEP